MDKRMHNDAAHFKGIKQAIAGRTDDKAPHRFYKHRRHFGMRLEIRECEIEFADKSHAHSFAAFFKLGENWSRSFSAPAFRMISDTFSRRRNTSTKAGSLSSSRTT